MMIATWRGMGPAPGITCVELSNVIEKLRCFATTGASYRHQLPLFVGDELVDVRDRLVGHLLHLVLRALLLVLAHFALLDERLEVGDRVAADVTDRDLGVLALVLHDLGHLAAAFLGERRHGYANDLPGG